MRLIRRALFLVAIGVAIAYIGLCGALFFLQRSMIYFPQPASPLAQGDVGSTVIALPVAEARVLASTRPKDGPGALIYFGGNAEDVTLSMPSFSAGFPGTAIYMLHYRGYGGSSGKPSEKALFEDALTLFDDVHARHADVLVVGRSLGSGVAVYLASMRPVKRLVLVTPYDSLQELAALQFPYFPVKWLLLDKYDSWRFAPQVTAPTLIIAAEHDELVPRANTELLRSRFQPELVTFKVLAGTRHNTISGSSEYMRLLTGS